MGGILPRQTCPKVKKLFCQLRTRRVLMLLNNVPLMRTTRALSLNKLSVAIVPFRFSVEHRLTALMSFWFSTDDLSFTCLCSEMICHFLH